MLICLFLIVYVPNTSIYLGKKLTKIEYIPISTQERTYQEQYNKTIEFIKEY